jgi:hypothetical protein
VSLTGPVRRAYLDVGRRRPVTVLRAAGFVALFVDFDPEEGILAGRIWKRELYAHLCKTDAMVVLASAASSQ